jgi:uncharacterized protein
MVVALLVWTLAAAPGLLRSARSSEIGARRTVSLDILRPIARVSAFLSLDRIGRGANAALGRADGGLGGPNPGDDLVGLGPPATAHPSPQPGSHGKLPPLHPPSAAHPLTILTVGDSLGIDLAIGMGRALSGQEGFDHRYDARISTGLARSDYFDWPAQFRRDVGRVRPNIVVAMFGTNDLQSFWDGHRYIRYGTPEWKPAYRAAVWRIMDAAHEFGARMIWVGLPPMAKEPLASGVRFLDGVFQYAASTRPGVTYVDTWSQFANAKGGYAAYLPDASGHEELVRRPDGVHLTAEGFDRLAHAVLQQMSTLWTR